MRFRPEGSAENSPGWSRASGETLGNGEISTHCPRLKTVQDANPLEMRIDYFLNSLASIFSRKLNSITSASANVSPSCLMRTFLGTGNPSVPFS